MATLYLIRGLPGSGKSTLAYELKLHNIINFVFEADDHFIEPDGTYSFDPARLKNAHNNCQFKTRDWLSGGYSVAVSNTSTTEAEVSTYQKIAEECNARFVSIVVESRHDGSNIHGVPPEKVEQMRKRFSVKV